MMTVFLGIITKKKARATPRNGKNEDTGKSTGKLITTESRTRDETPLMIHTPLNQFRIKEIFDEQTG